MPTPQPIQPIQQPVIESLKNALQVAQLRLDAPMYGGSTEAFAAIVRLLRGALAGLEEPNETAIRAADVLLRSYNRDTIDAAGPLPRAARDTCAAILTAQLTGTL